MAVIRDAEVADARGLAEVHVRSWQVAYRGLFPDSFLDGLTASLDDRTEWRESQLARQRAGYSTILAEESGEVLGFVDTGPTRDEDLASAGEIFSIYVEPRHWRRGLGRLLLAAAEKRMSDDGFYSCTLWVLDGNQPARCFYEVEGWETDGSEKTDEIGGTEVDEVRYRKKLG